MIVATGSVAAAMVKIESLVQYEAYRALWESAGLPCPISAEILEDRLLRSLALGSDACEALDAAARRMQ